jgi:glycosyltransferase involved in cell wall biosynthesis
MNNESKVSVVIPVYNREKTIRRAIDSVLSQSYKNIELIVVDDASTDSSATIVNEYQDERLHLIQLKENGGANVARNVGIRKAVGDIIAFQDSDDEWLNDKLELQLDYMKKMKCDVVACSYIQVMDEIERQIPSVQQISRVQSVGVREVLREYNVVGTPTLMIKRSVVESVGYFDECMPRLQDYEYAIRISKKYDIEMMDTPLVYAYIGEDNITNNHIALQSAFRKLLSKHGKFFNMEGFINAHKGVFMMDSQGNSSELSEMADIYAKGNIQDRLYFYESFIKVFEDDYFLLRKFNELASEYQLKRLKNKKFVIYGAGDMGKYVFVKLKKNGLTPLNFVVTKIDAPQEVGGVKVIEAEKIKDKDIMVVVAVSDKNKKQVLPYMNKLGLKNWIVGDYL